MTSDERKETRTSAVIVPLGPYHPALAEPYALHVRLRGERIVAASQPVSGIGQRGLLDLLVGHPLADGLVVLERACPHAGQGYRLALSLATERAARIAPPRAAQLTRVVFAELEMAQSALWTLSELARALNLHKLRATGLDQRERIYAAAEQATGERVYWGVAQPGGVREGIQLADVRTLLPWLPEVVAIWRAALAPAGALRKATERIAEGAAERGAKPSGAASLSIGAGASVSTDARRRAPYDGYRAITLDWSPLDEAPIGAGVDGVSEVTRAALRLMARLKLSVDIMHVCAEALGDGARGRLPTRAQTPLQPGQGSADVQTAHGPARIEVTLAPDLTIAQARLLTPCAAALAQAHYRLPGHWLAQAPALLVSQSLCPACADL